jgi:hypothetical protein
MVLCVSDGLLQAIWRVKEGIERMSEIEEKVEGASRPRPFSALMKKDARSISDRAADDAPNRSDDANRLHDAAFADGVMLKVRHALPDACLVCSDSNSLLNDCHALV